MKANLHNLLKTVLYILGPIACWCPMSPHFLTRWVPRLLGLAQVSWATTRVVSIAFSPSPSISRCFSIHSSPAIGFHLCFFFTTDVSAPIRSTHHLLMVSFQAWDWLWYLMLWSQRQRMKQKSCFRFLPCLGFQPQTLQSKSSRKWYRFQQVLSIAR